MKPGSSTRKTVDELFIPGTAPDRAANVGVAVDVDSASGLKWREGCAGPMVTRTFIDFSNVENGYPVVAAGRHRLAGARGARRRACRAGPKGTHTAYLYGSGFFPFGASWGGKFAPTKTCKLAPPPPTPCISIDPFNPCPSAPPEPSPSPGDGGLGFGNGNGGTVAATAARCRGPRAARSSRRPRPRRAHRRGSS